MGDNAIKTAGDSAAAIPNNASDKNDKNLPPLILNLEETEEDPDRNSCAGPVWQLRCPAPILSPMTEIAVSFGESSITTPKARREKKARFGELEPREIEKKFGFGWIQEDFGGIRRF